jgi:hypothetical protein
LSYPYNANARTNPPTIANPADATFATAALAVVVELAAVELTEVELAFEEVFVAAVVSVDDSVTFELDWIIGVVELVEDGALEDVEVVTTVTVDEGTDDVVVLV